jgi:hypothetical protein
MYISCSHNEKGLKNCTRKESTSKKKSEDKEEKLLNNKKEESDQKLENKSDEIKALALYVYQL